MFHVILFQPEIPPNTGNLIRLCANVGATLHLVHPLGFELGRCAGAARRARLSRAWRAYASTSISTRASPPSRPARVFALTTRATRSVYDAAFAAGDAFLFGPETRGLPQTVLETIAAGAAAAHSDARRAIAA